MKYNIIIKTIIYIVCAITLTFIFNFVFFHKEAISKEEEHIETCVYISNSGDCYHSEYCAYIDEIYAIGEDQAKSKGYRRCNYCDAFSVEKICVINTIHLDEENNYPASFFLSCIICLGYSLINKNITQNKIEE